MEVCNPNCEVRTQKHTLFKCYELEQRRILIFHLSGISEEKGSLLTKQVLILLENVDLSCR